MTGSIPPNGVPSKQPHNIIGTILALIARATACGLLQHWNSLADWMVRKVLPYFEKNQPNLKPLVQKVFNKINAIAIPVIQQLRQDWGELKLYFIGQLCEFERENPNSYSQRIVSYFRKKLEDGKETFVKVTEETVTDPLTLPSAIYEEVIVLDHCVVNTIDIVDRTVEELDNKAAGRKKND